MNTATEGKASEDVKPLCGPAKDMEGKTTRRHTLKREEKLRILEERDRRVREGLTVRQNDLMQWAKVTFCLETAPSQSAMSRILCTKDKSALMTMPKVRRNRGGKLPDLEKTLAAWVRAQQAAQVVVKGDMIKEKGKSVLDDINTALPPSEQMSMQFSTGWLCNFQRRWNLRLSAKEPRGEDQAGGLDDMENLEDVMGTVNGMEGPATSFVPVLDRAAAQIGALPAKRGATDAGMPAAKAERIPFWFIGLGKLSDEQFATRFVNYICKRVDVSNKQALRDAARTAAKDNGIDGSTAVLSGNDEDELAEVLLDDFRAGAEEKGAIVAAGKQFFVELDLSIDDSEKLSHPGRKKQKQGMLG